MREIKFRRWELNPFDDIWDWHYYELPDAITEENYTNPESVKNETLSEFTGLKDCNGKEIYEGDVVKHHGAGKITAVEYYNASFLPFDEGDFGWTSTFCEVIGNIHENPELLTDKDDK